MQSRSRAPIKTTPQTPAKIAKQTRVTKPVAIIAAPAAAETICVPRSVDPQLRQQRIAKAAYLSAEHRGFPQGGEMRDWLRAEQEIDRAYDGMHFCGD